MLGSFTYLEVGSYLGGSLQVVVRDPRCTGVLSIDPRPRKPPDKRFGSYTYEDNSTARMLELLRTVPEADLEKLTTFEVGTDGLRVDDLPTRPDYCFIDGEHTDDAVLRDARFCAEALPTAGGVVAFHDYESLIPAIRTFVRESWADISLAVAFVGLVFAVEFGDRGILRKPVVERAIDSRWHAVAWTLASRSQSSLPFVALWAAMPVIDRLLLRGRSALGRPGQSPYAMP
jgi:hypothetical protein